MAMQENQFWNLIDGARAKAAACGCETGDEFLDQEENFLRQLLDGLSAEEILEFERCFAALSVRAYRWDLWAAGYWICGGCSDDGFIDFRSSLISLGKQRFEQVLEDPDSLADMIGKPDVPTLGIEGFQYIASEVYQKKTGARPKDRTGYPIHPKSPEGEYFDFDDIDEMRRRLPRLIMKFPRGAY